MEGDNVTKTKKIIFRVSESMFDFVESFSKAVNIEKSELMRKLVEHYFLEYFSSEKNNTFEALKREFTESDPVSKAQEEPLPQS